MRKTHCEREHKLTLANTRTHSFATSNRGGIEKIYKSYCCKRCESDRARHLYATSEAFREETKARARAAYWRRKAECREWQNATAKP